MSHRTIRLTLTSTVLLLAVSCALADEDLSTMRGANYVPSYAKNDVAIWLDYDATVIDRELGYAEQLKLNTIRIFLNQAVYEQDPQQFLDRFESFLVLCDKHKIRAMPVLFDSCFDPQIVDLKDYRDKTWMPSPGFSRLGAKDRPAMEDYIEAVVGTHKGDRRIVLWDVMNEPESTAYWADLDHGGRDTIGQFVRWALGRVKEEEPLQPLTVGWAGAGANILTIDLVDVICIHFYCPAEDLNRAIQECQHWGQMHGKQVILNEFAGQPQQPLERALAIVDSRRMGWVFWELMIGKSQFSQGSAPYQGHIYPDGTCRSVREVAAILHPAGYTGDPREIAAQAGFHPRTLIDEGITFEGAWARWNGKGPQSDRLWHAGNPDDAAKKTVSGSTVSVVLKFGPDCGIAKVLIDGQPASPAEIDTYSPEVDWNRSVVVGKELAAGEHTVEVVVTGRKSAQSTFRFIQVVDIVGPSPQ